MSKSMRTIVPFALGLVAAAFVLAGMTGPLEANLLVGVASVAYRDGLHALLWWAASCGLGLGIVRVAIGPSVQSIASAAMRRTLGDGERTTLDELAIALGLGSAAMLFLDTTLGSLGVITAGGGLIPWVAVGIGVVVGARVLRDAPIRGDHSGSDDDQAPPAISRAGQLAFWAALGAVAGLLIVAASNAPGWLWSSEFKGYDALSYHLTLPKHWLTATGTIAPVTGNVYSALPSFVESAFMHLMLVRGTPIDGAFACQWWAVLATLATAFVVARLGRAMVDETVGFLAAAVFLAVPWTMVVGTLAYNDMYPCLALAAGWLLLVRATESERRLDVRAAIALAVLAAAAFGAKPSALFFTAIPLLVITIMRAGPRSLKFAPVVLGVGALMLAPWMVRNGLAYGNPFFPFLRHMFGAGPWSEEQAQVFLAAHGPVGGVGDRLGALVQQWLLYGFVAAPSPTEPWFPLWSVAPIAGLIGLAVASRRSAWARQALAVTAAMCAGWLLATHLKSRFMLPAVVPMALGATVLLAMLGRKIGRQYAAWTVLIALALPFVTYMREPMSLKAKESAIGQAPTLVWEEGRAPSVMIDGMANRTGEAISMRLKQAKTPEEQRELAQQIDSAFALNFAIPPEAKVVAIGYSTPFYSARVPSSLSWNTVWDRGEFDRVVEESPNAPTEWGVKLRSRGYAFAIVDRGMLEVWAQAGWINPALASGAWLAPFIASNTVFTRTTDGKLILLLQPPPQQQPQPQQPATQAPPTGLPGGMPSAQPDSGQQFTRPLTAPLSDPLTPPAIPLPSGSKP